MYDTDVAEGCDAKRDEKKEEHHAEKKGRPGWCGREHVLLQYIKTCGNLIFRNYKGQICGHQRVENSQDQSPHEDATDDCSGLPLPGLPEVHGLDYAKVAVNADSHHGQDGAIHVGVEDQGHETIWGYNKEEKKIRKG